MDFNFFSVEVLIGLILFSEAKACHTLKLVKY